MLFAVPISDDESGDDTHAFAKPVVQRFPGSEGSRRSNRPAAAERQTGPPERTAGSFSADLQTVTQDDQEIVLLAVRGEVDLATAPLVREALLAVLERETGPVVIDLSEVAFMDSNGVHVLVDTHRRLTPENRRFAIACREGGQIHRLLALVGLLDILTVHRSRESALSGGDELMRSGPRNNGWSPAAGALRRSPAVYQPSRP